MKFVVWVALPDKVGRVVPIALQPKNAHFWAFLIVGQ